VNLPGRCELSNYALCSTRKAYYYVTQKACICISKNGDAELLISRATKSQ